MRLSKWEIDSIKNIVNRFDEKAIIYLFGSRIDDTKRGGDIDLLICSEILSASNKIDILIKFKTALGDQKIDLLIKTKSQIKNDEFCQSLQREQLP